MKMLIICFMCFALNASGQLYRPLNNVADFGYSENVKKVETFYYTNKVIDDYNCDPTYNGTRYSIREFNEFGNCERFYGSGNGEIRIIENEYRFNSSRLKKKSTITTIKNKDTLISMINYKYGVSDFFELKDYENEGKILRYYFNQQELVTKVERWNNGSLEKVVTEMEYKDGKIVGWTSTINEGEIHYVKKTYDAKGRPDKFTVSDELGNILSYSYDVYKRKGRQLKYSSYMKTKGKGPESETLNCLDTQGNSIQTYSINYHSGRESLKENRFSYY